MRNVYFIGGIILGSTYTYFLTTINIYRNYLLIPNKDLPKNMQRKYN
jgi:hypothetical protein